jgi:hypothetical protein
VSGLLVVVGVRAQSVVDSWRAGDLEATRWNLERLLAAVEKARAGGAPRGADGRRVDWTKLDELRVDELRRMSRELEPDELAELRELRRRETVEAFRRRRELYRRSP